MRTRSGKTYNFNKCHCGIYYKSPIFKHRCSQCFSIKYPEKWQKIIKDHSKFGLNGDIDQGDTVMLIGYNKKGIVQKVYHDKSQALITLGQLEIEVALEDLEFVSKNQGSSSKSVKPRSKIDVDGVASMSLDLRGYSADDALVELDQFLDKALLGNLVSIKVITGKGVLENIIFDYLIGCSKNNGENKWSVSRRSGAFVISYD